MSFHSFTSESVCAGHPDKICDAISDAVVDAAYQTDPMARVAVETMVTEDFVVLAGEVTVNGPLNYRMIAKDVIRDLGYTDPTFKFTSDSPVSLHIHVQSPEIAVGVDHDGAGDQGMMFGYACRQTPAYMPLPIQLAHELTAAIDTARESHTIPYLRPDGKAQVTISYDHDQPKQVEAIVLAAPHAESVTQKELSHDLYDIVVAPLLEKYHLKFSEKQLIVNGTGVWYLPGPASDTGVTGRKIVVDTYGGYARVGGGAFSGKDATKVDRSGAYAARYLAKNIVAAGLADQCEIALAYYIGAQKPLMQQVETFGTSKVSEKVINDYVGKLLDLSVSGIIKGLDLRRPIYRQTAAYGHFGRPQFPWEQIKEI